MAVIAGVDGCKAGWLILRKDLDSGKVTSEVHSSGKHLINLSAHPEIIAVDIPIGLTDSGPRQCDLIARKLLGQPRGRSVFPAPIRPALSAADRREADSISRSIDGRGVGAQAFGLYQRIREIDAIMRNSEEAREFIYEVHPELCFMAWNGGTPIQESKRSLEGMGIRRDLVRSHFGEEPAVASRQRHPSSQVADDDIFDAFAALWTAERIHLGIAKVIPNPPENDSFELAMAMWF